MDSELYFKRKVNRNVRIVVWICILAYVLVYALAIRKHVENGVYTKTEVLTITLGYMAIVFVMWLLCKLFSSIAFRSKNAFIAMMVIYLVFGMWILVLLMIPIWRYHNGEEAGDASERRVDRRVFRATVKAYQKAWRRQNVFARAVLPLIVLAATAAIVGVLYFINLLNPTVFAWIMVIGFLLIAVALLGLMGGIRDVKITTTEYNVSVGTGWFDYGEVYVTEGSSKTKDGTDVSIVGFIIACFLTPFVIFAAIILLLVWLVINLVKIILPVNSYVAIYMHKKTAIHQYYVLGPTILKGIMFTINKLFMLVFKVNLVSREFWEDGIGPRYIEEYLSPKNERYLDKLLDRVERKYGYRHYW